MKSMMTACVVALAAGLASGDVYNDNFGNHLAGGDLHDFFASQGFNHLDIVWVSVTNDATNLYFTVQLNGDLDATNWGKYCVAIDNMKGGLSSPDNGWFRNANWGRNITHWIGTWADDWGSGIGGQVWDYSSGSWNLTAGLTSSDDTQHGAGRQIFSVSLASLGVGIGDTIEFDVISTGGGDDPGVDHLSNPFYATDSWGNWSQAGLFLSYTIVPAPSAAALLGMGGVMMMARRRR
ncbi:MAG: PEP-CTERM sorting domain-containing protein [Phycisphaerales bacterium]|nr:PEP-CTERM sorting domain-containing protein [Phycisphaerales bacterium]